MNRLSLEKNHYLLLWSFSLESIWRWRVISYTLQKKYLSPVNESERHFVSFPISTEIRASDYPLAGADRLVRWTGIAVNTQEQIKLCYLWVAYTAHIEGLRAGPPAHSLHNGLVRPAGDTPLCSLTGNQGTSCGPCPEHSGPAAQRDLQILRLCLSEMPWLAQSSIYSINLFTICWKTLPNQPYCLLK